MGLIKHRKECDFSNRCFCMNQGMDVVKEKWFAKIIKVWKGMMSGIDLN